MSELEDWRQPIQSFQCNLKKVLSGEGHGKRSIKQELEHLGIVVNDEPGSISSESLLLQQQLVALSRVVEHSKSANVHNVLANIELAACGMALLANDSWGAMEDTAGLAEIMKL